MDTNDKGPYASSEPRAVAAWDHPKVVALAKALSEAEMFYDDRDWLVLAEVALIHLGLMEWVEVTDV